MDRKKWEVTILIGICWTFALLTVTLEWWLSKAEFPGIEAFMQNPAWLLAVGVQFILFNIRNTSRFGFDLLGGLYCLASCIVACAILLQERPDREKVVLTVSVSLSTLFVFFVALAIITISPVRFSIGLLCGIASILLYRLR